MCVVKKGLEEKEQGGGSSGRDEGGVASRGLEQSLQCVEGG